MISAPRLILVAALVLGVRTVSAQTLLFDFDNASAGSPLPISLTASGLTATFRSSNLLNNYSIQSANVLGFTPAGFSGLCIYPSTVFASDLLIAFDQPIEAISLLYAPEEYATDSSCTMRITAYQGSSVVGTNTYSIQQPGTWPTGTLSFSSAQPFDNVVVHYASPPPTGGDYGPIFMVDNVSVTPTPEPGVLCSLALGLFALSSRTGYRRKN